MVKECLLVLSPPMLNGVAQHPRLGALKRKRLRVEPQDNSKTSEGGHTFEVNLEGSPISPSQSP